MRGNHPPAGERPTSVAARLEPGTGAISSHRLPSWSHFQMLPSSQTMTSRPPPDSGATPTGVLNCSGSFVTCLPPAL